MGENHECIQKQNIDLIKEDVKGSKEWQREQNGHLREQSQDIKEVMKQVQEINNKITRVETARETEKAEEEKRRMEKGNEYTDIANTRGWIMMVITLASLLVAASSIIFA